jgi:hypothetical protein
MREVSKVPAKIASSFWRKISDISLIKLLMATALRYEAFSSTKIRAS